MKLVIGLGALGLAMFAAPANAASLLVNGDFEAGIVGFSTGHTIGDPTLAEGVVGLATSSPGAWSAWTPTSFGDHTSGSGQMLIFNAATTPNVSMWEQSVDLVAGVSYEFTGWTALLTFTAPTFEFRVGSDVIGSFAASEAVAEWQSFSFQFVAAVTGNALLSLYETTLVAGGNDFSLDDLSLIGAEPTFRVAEIVTPLPGAAIFLLTGLFGGVLARRRGAAAV